MIGELHHWLHFCNCHNTLSRNRCICQEQGDCEVPSRFKDLFHYEHLLFSALLEGSLRHARRSEGGRGGSAVLLAAVALFIIGAFKSAAITPPIGVNLDTKENYFNIDTFYSSIN